MVVDASAVFEILTVPSPRVLAKIEGRALQAPHLLDVEVLHALRRHERLGNIDSRRAQESLDVFLSMPVARFEHAPLLRRAWQLRANLTGYDAIYVALAESLDAPLLTCDARLRAAPGHRAIIELL